MHRKSLLFLLNFSFYSIFSETETLEKLVSTTAYEKFGGIFFSLSCLHEQNQCDPVVPSGDVCD